MTPIKGFLAEVEFRAPIGRGPDDQVHGIGSRLETLTQGGAPAVRPPLASSPAAGRGSSRLRALALSGLLALSSLSPHPRFLPPSAAWADSAAAHRQPHAAAQFKGEISISQPARFGRLFAVKLRLRNDSGVPVEVSPQKALAAALPGAFEVWRPDPQEKKRRLEAGESAEWSYQLMPFQAGRHAIADIELKAVPAGGQGGRELMITVPGAGVEVAPELAPGEKAWFDDIDPSRTPDRLNVGVIGALALLAAAAAAGFGVGLRARYRGLKRQSASPAFERARALGRSLDSMSQFDFYTEAFETLSMALLERFGLELPAPGTATLKEAVSGLALSREQQAVFEKLADNAQRFRFEGGRAGPEQRRADNDDLTALIRGLGLGSEAQPRASGARLMDLSLPMGLILTWEWGSLAALPFLAAYFLVRYVLKGRRPALKAPSLVGYPKTKSWRQRLLWVDNFLRFSEIALVILALMGPSIGYMGKTSVVPVTRSVVNGDNSGSMSGFVAALQEAIRRYVLEQRKGSDNLIALVTFGDRAYLVSGFASDTDALIGARAQFDAAGGSTALGDGQLLSLELIIRTNLEELQSAEPAAEKTAGAAARLRRWLGQAPSRLYGLVSGQMSLKARQDPRVERALAILESSGLASAVRYLEDHPDLLKKVLRPEEWKVVISVTDGDSNTGIKPIVVARMVKDLNEKHGFNGHLYFIETVSPSGTGQPSTSQLNMRKWASMTGGKSYAVSDEKAFVETMLEISQREKQPAVVRDQRAQIHYEDTLVLLALVLFLIRKHMGLWPLRRFEAIAAVMALALALPALELALPSPAQASQTPAPASRSGAAALFRQQPLELARGNQLYEQGDYQGAVLAYRRALRDNPDMPEIYINLGHAYYRMGKLPEAQSNYAQAAASTPDPKVASVAYNHAGRAAIAKWEKDQKDVASFEEGVRAFRRALREYPDNDSARKNLAVAMSLMKEKKGQPGDKAGKSGDKKGQKGEKNQAKDKDSSSQEQAPSEPEPAEDQVGSGQGLKKLIDQIEAKQKANEEAKRRAIIRKGDNVWSVLLSAGLLSALLGAPTLAHAGEAAASGLAFSAPWVLSLLPVILVVLAGVLAANFMLRLRDRRLLRSPPAASDPGFDPGRRRFLIRSALSLGIGAGLGLAAAGPLHGEKPAKLRLPDADFIFISDASTSGLDAIDGRGERMVQGLSSLLDRVIGRARLGLVAMAGSARWAAFLSIHHGNLRRKIQEIRDERAGLNPGSNIIEAIVSAAKMRDKAKRIGDGTRPTHVIYYGDGDFGIPGDRRSAAQWAEEAAELARKEGLIVHAVGVGSEKGVEMRVPTLDGQGFEYVLNEKGDIAKTRLDREALGKLTRGAGGELVIAEEGQSIGGLIESIALKSGGSREEVIEVAQPVSRWFLIPTLGLMLLDYLLGLIPPRSNGGLREAAGAGLVLGAIGSLSPLFSLTVAAALLGLAGLAVIELLSGGFLHKRVRAALQARRGDIERGIETDLPVIFGLTGFRSQQLAGFSRRWAKASESGKRGLVVEAYKDALAPHMLVAAFLSRNSRQVQELLADRIGELNRGGQRTDALTLRLLDVRARRGLAWLDHLEVARNLERLTGAGSRAAERPQQAAPTRTAAIWRRPASWAAALILAISLPAAGFLSYQAASRWAGRPAADSHLFENFWGEHADIFHADYSADPLIVTRVLPVLRAPERIDPEALDRAIEILRDSPHPGADNILEALFTIDPKLLSMRRSTEDKLLAGMIVRENDAVIDFLSRRMLASAEEPEIIRRLLRMVELGTRIGGERVFNRLFVFLRSSNSKVQEFTARAIMDSLFAGNKFMAKLDAVSKAHENDPGLQFWAQRFLFQYLSSAGQEGDYSKGTAIMDRAFDAYAKADEERVKAIEKVMEGQKAEVPDSWTEQGLALALGAPLSNRGVLSRAVEIQAHRQARAIVKQGLELFPALEAALKANGVLREIPPSRPTRDPRERLRALLGPKPMRSYYKVVHINDLGRAANSTARAAASGGRLSPQQLEFADRSARSLPLLAEIASRVGVVPGGSAEDRIADKINLALDEIWRDSKFSYLEALRHAKLAPPAFDMGYDDDLVYYQSYDLGTLRRLRNFLSEARKSGEWRTQRQVNRMEWKEKRAIILSLAKIDGIVAAFHPGQAREDSLFQALSELPLIANSDSSADQNVRQKIEAAFSAASDPDVFLTYFSGFYNQIEADKIHAHFWVMEFLGRNSKGMDAQGVEDVLTSALGSLKIAGKLEALKGLSSGLNAAIESRNPLAQSILSKLALEVIDETFRYTLVSGAQSRLKAWERLEEVGIIVKKYSQRYLYKLKHLRAFERLHEELWAKRVGFDEEGRKTLDEHRAILPVLLELAEKAGVYPGDTVEDALAEKVNEALFEVIQPFPVASLLQKMKEADLVRQDYSKHLHEGSVDSYHRDELLVKEAALFPRYSKEMLRKIYHYLDGILKQGIWGKLEPAQGYAWWNSIDFKQPVALNDEQKAALRKALGELERIYNSHFPGQGGLKDMDRRSQMSRFLLSKDSRWTHGGNYVGAALLSVSWLGLATSAAEASEKAVTFLGLPWFALAFFAAIPALIFWAGLELVRGWRGRRKTASPAREPSPEVLARYKDLDLEVGPTPNSFVAGATRSRKVGVDGLEFAEMSRYRGGETRNMDWELYVRTGELYVRRKNIDQNLPRLIVLDLSRSAPRRAAQDIATLVALNSGHHSIPIGAIILGGRQPIFMPPRSGRAYAMQIVERFAEFEPEAGSGHLGPGLAKALEVFRSRGRVVVISDFLEPAQAYAGPLKRLAQRQNLHLIRLALRPDLPGAIADLEDAETGLRAFIDGGSRAVQDEVSWKIRQLQREFELAAGEARIPPVSVQPESGYVETVISHYRSLKQSRRRTS
ncbi:MAG: tetratricopeptide repeat protein [Elusimicrobia bacterium]|nr:tetratricopeptide repeat protein [Elusimicrobiota bacterium]